jgi:integrase/recombinase XerC
MANKGNKPSVIRRRIAGIRAFYRFLHRIGKVAVNPALRLPLPKVPKRLPRFISVEGMEKLGSGHLFPSDFSGHRDRLILELLYGTGMRRAEVANLKETDIQWDRKEINVLGKGGKSRVIPVVSSLYILLTRYREERNALFENGAVTFFVTDKGRNIYTRFVYAVSVRYLGMVTSIENKGPHLLRHTFATHLMSNGADIQAVKALLGHSSLAATQVYMHNSADRLKKIYNQAHPRAQRKNPDNKG